MKVREDYILVKIPRNFYNEDDDHIYKARSVRLRPGLSVLVGCNGAGKSTLLKMINNSCYEKGILVHTYSNLFDGNVRANGTLSDTIQSLMSSEGENVVNNFLRNATVIGKFVSSAIKSNATKIVILIDGVDSGLSIDMIDEMKSRLFQMIIEDCKSRGLAPYIVVSANSYELVSGQNCIDVYTGKYVSFKSYEEYKSFILNSRKIKDERFTDSDEGGN